MKIKTLTPRQKRKSIEDWMLAACTGLEEVEQRQNLLLEQIAELNLRVRYCMEAIKHRTDPLIVGAEPTVRSLYECYMSGDRERFLARLEVLANAGPNVRAPGKRAEGSGGDDDSPSRSAIFDDIGRAVDRAEVDKAVDRLSLVR